MGPKNIIFCKRKNHPYYPGLKRSPIPSGFPQNFIFCFVSNSKGDHGLITTELVLKNFYAIMGVASGRQEQSYGIVTIAIEKGHPDSRVDIRYDEHFLTPQKMKTKFMLMQSNTLIQHPDVAAYTIKTRSDPRMGSSYNACSSNSTHLAIFFIHVMRRVFQIT